MTAQGFDNIRILVFLVNLAEFLFYT